MRHLYFLFTIIIVSISGCSDKNDAQPEETTPFLTIPSSSISAERINSSKEINFQTNISNLKVSVYPSEWCSAYISNGNTLTIVCATNPEADTRMATVTIQDEKGTIKKTVIVKQDGRNDTSSDIPDDIKLPVSRSTASSSQPGSGIERSHDGNLSTLYHSNYANSSANYFPITLSYYFDKPDTINYITYHPRSSGNNGIFKEFDVYAVTESNPSATLLGSYTLSGTNTASQIRFNTSILKVKEIRFVIKSGYGDGNGFASCAEMEFYKNNSNKFNYSTIFTDPSCSKIKSGVTETQIREIKNSFFRDLALEILKGEYDSEFRVQSYRSWQNPGIMAAANKTSTYGLRDNPTGIFAKKGEEIVVLANETHNQNISVFIQDPDNKISGSSYPIHTGINKFTANNTGLIYVMYYTKNGTESPVTINFAKGNVNGYFDSQKHSQDDWSRLLNKATFRHFDVVGKYAGLTFETSAFKQYTPNGLALINTFDEIVYNEQDFMGLVKYNCQYNNRAYFLVVYTPGSYMFSTGNYTGYINTVQSDLLDVDKLRTSSIWGVAHELGHTHQTRPGMRWIGTTEVTNNIHSLYIQTLFGNKSRLLASGVYAKAITEIVNAKIPHAASTDVFHKLVPFWQLKLYLMDALDKKDFYKDVYQQVRTNPNPETNGECQLQFVKICCKAANLDLTEFFEQWGFLKAVSLTINDYSTSQMIISQERVDEVKAEIAAHNYPKPVRNDIYKITDENVDNYREKAASIPVSRRK